MTAIHAPDSGVDPTGSRPAACRLLLVEDDPGDVRLIEAALGSATVGSFEVVHADRLDAAIQLLDTTTPDAVLLDLGLPDSQGLATFQRFHTRHPDVPVIVLTGLEDDDLALEAVHEGAQDYVVKGSLGEHHLVRVVRHALERQLLTHEVRRLAAQRATLVALSQRALGDTSVDDLLHECVTLVADALAVDRVAIIEHGPGHGTVRAAAGWSHPIDGATVPEPTAEIRRRVSRDGIAVIEDRVAEEIPPPALPGCEDVRSGLSIEIAAGATPFGRLAVLDRRPRSFDDETIGFLTTTANILSEAVRRDRAERDLTERIKELTALAAVGRLTQAIDDPAAMATAVASTLIEAVQVPDDAVAVVELPVEGTVHQATATGDGVGRPVPTIVEELSAPIRFAEHRHGRVSFGYVRPRGFLLPFEQDLIDRIAEKLGLWLEHHLAVASLAARESEQELILSQLPGTVWATDRTLRFTRSVGSSLADLGREPDEVVGRPLGEVDTTGAALAAHERALEGEEDDYTWQERGRVWQAHVQPLRNLDGRIEGVIGVGIDVTDRETAARDLDDSRRRLQGLFDNALDGIMLFDDDGVYVDVNPALCALTGYAREELVGQPMGVLSLDPERSRRLFLELRQTGVITVSTTFLHRDGHRIEIDAQAKADVVPGLHMVMFRDVTEQRRAEQRLEASERRYRSLVQNASDLVLVLDRDGRATDVSPASRRILGIDPADVVGHQMSDFVLPEDRERSAVVWSEAVDTVDAVPAVTLRVRHADGSHRWLECVLTNLLGDPAVGGIVVNARDVTDRMRADQARRRSEERLRFVFEQLPAVVWTVDPDLRITSHVGRGHEHAGMEAEMFVGEDAAAIVGAGSRGIDAAQRAVAAGESTVYTEYFASRWWETHVEPLRDLDDTIVGAVGLALDITDVKLAERQLEENRRRLEGLFANTIDAILLADNEGRYVDVNPAAERLTGYSRAELLTMTVADLSPGGVHDADTDEAFRAFIEAGAASGPFTLRRRDGTLVDTEFRASANIVPGIHMSVMQDVTERVRAEHALRDSEARFRRITENAQDVIYRLEFTDPPSFSYVSPAIRSVLGYAPQDLYDDPELAMQLVHPEDHARLGLRLDRPRDRGEPLVLRWRRRDGTYVWVDMRHTLIRDDDGRVVASEGVVRDVTERIEAEEHLRTALEREHEAARHLRALDEMKNTFLSAVSHELRTPLTSVSGFAQLLRQHDEHLPPEQRHQMLDRLAANAERLSVLLGQLLDLDRLTRGALQLQTQTVDLAELVTATLEEPPIDAHRPIRASLAPVRVVADAPKIERIVENLVVNALRHTPPGALIHVRVEESDGGGLIVVDDSGPGVPDELKSEIFEPFRLGDSDAARVGGTGIGLSIVARFTALHGGRAWVEDRPGGGASFRVWLPTEPTPPMPSEPLDAQPIER